MDIKTLAPLKVFLLSIFIVSQFSCSKDSDLITDYVLSETQNTLDLSELILDDTFFITSKASITLDVLANDGFENEQVVMLTETSEPENGTVVINTDNTLTYTPNNTVDTTEEVEDTFTYTTEVVNEDETVSTGTGNVTVTSENKAPITGDNVYYVTTTGKANNNGRSEATAWSIQHAFATADAGDIIYVKSGDYVVNVNLTPNSGTKDYPVKFVGYKNTPGDVVSTNGATVTYEDYLANSKELDPTDMPLIHRSSIQMVNEDRTRRGIDISSKSYVEIENLQFKWQQEAIYGFQHGAGIKLKNLVIAWVGNFNPVDTWSDGRDYDPPLPPEASGRETTNLTGKGIDVSGANGALIENCTVINSGHVGIVSGTISTYPVTKNAIIRGCKVYSDQNINPGDYYIEMYYSQDGLIEDCEVYRLGGLVHQGHGIDLKNQCSNITIQNCYVENTYLEVNSGNHNNTFENITVKGMQNYSPNRRSGGLKIYADSYSNTFKNIKFIDADGILFADVYDHYTSPTNAGHDNIFIECLFQNSQYNSYRGSHSPITFEANKGLEDGGFNDTPVYNNKWYNCTFDTAPALFTVNRPNYGNELIDCNISNVPNIVYSASWGDTLNAIYTNCNFVNSQVP